jgi:hypothetical protein
MIKFPDSNIHEIHKLSKNTTKITVIVPMSGWRRMKAAGLTGHDLYYGKIVFGRTVSSPKISHSIYIQHTTNTLLHTDN